MPKGRVHHATQKLHVEILARERTIPLGGVFGGVEETHCSPRSRDERTVMDSPNYTQYEQSGSPQHHLVEIKTRAGVAVAQYKVL